ncbi:class IIb bacteriocin, lactobin A/cerein 7B family [Pseudolactococcus reticulitermitis]|uniref:Class IIb bacteriocin, lactobin A/cerein 7B family n=1 Tax=Pseudolactococcus reticulitermitis TaxID=2025039 RepID=A0A224X2Z1_9LACT|nr:class IIb bacteriocin, lactobin A/cerein 7B family [Lactococcus reticulitermitis]GAX48427.1 hypothetical protein RsY01_2050 [Lactococcus reticulitermitis]
MKKQTILELNQLSGFRDLSEGDMQEVTGGVAPLVVIGGIIVVGFVLGTVNGCSNAKKK